MKRILLLLFCSCLLYFQADAQISWPWRSARMGYLKWWSTDIGWRVAESFQLRPGVRYFNQKSILSYNADRTVVGGEIVIDEDILNQVDLPRALENNIRDLRIELPTGQLTREVNSWSLQSQVELQVAGILIRGIYWSGALSPRQFPQPQDLEVLFSSDRLIEVVTRELATSAAFNHAVSYEIAIRPIHFLTGFRPLELFTSSGVYLGTDFAFGWVKSTDLTFKQGRELLTDVDLEAEISSVLPSVLESLINTEEAADVLLTAVESRLPLYGFGIPIVDGSTTEASAWLGYQWNNTRWAGDVRLGLLYQRQTLRNDHPSEPELRIRRWTPTINFKWIFNKQRSQSSLISDG